MNTTMARYSLVVAAASIFFSALFSNLAYAQGPEYELQEIKAGENVVSAGGYNSMFLVTQEGVVVVDAPPAIADKISAAVSEVTRGINGSNAMTEAYFNALTKSCADKIDSEWQGKLEGVGVWTVEHCERMIISTRVD